MQDQAVGAAARGAVTGRNRLFWKLFFGFWLTLLAAGVAVGVAVWFHQEQQRAAASEAVLAAGPRTATLLRSAAASLRYGGEAALRAMLADPDALPRGDATLYAVDENGGDLLGRTVPADALADARSRAGARLRDVRGPSDRGSTRDAPDTRGETRPARERTSGPPPYGPGGRYNVLVVESATGRSWLLFVSAAGQEARTAAAGSASDAGRDDARETSARYRERGYRASPRAPAPWWRVRLDPLTGIAIGLLASLVSSGLLAWYLTRPIRHLRGAFASVADGRLDTRVAPLMGRRVDEIAGLGHDFDLMAERLQKLIVSQQRLLHDVSHELRSPLARLQAAIGLARQSPERGAAMLERIEREAQRLDALVGELLALARLEANATDSPARSTELQELLDEVLADARFEAQAVGKDVRFDTPAVAHGVRPDARAGERGKVCAAEHAIVIATRADWLQRAFENVIRNAIRHTAPGSAVEIAVASPRADRVSVTIADRGPGVAADELETIFEPFQRGRGAVGQGGYGLGLAIARRAVAAHGGTIVASHRDGGGLLMTIELPTASAETTRPG